MRRIGLIGDLHRRDAERIQRAMQISEPDFCLQVGDYSYADIAWPFPVYWIPGNHENIDIAKIKDGTFKLPANNIMLDVGLYNIQNVNVLALPTIVVPGNKPGPAIYKPEDYNKCLQTTEDVDIFLSHGCGFPFTVYVPFDRKFVNAEDTKLTELIKKVKPKYAVSGHNHESFREEQYGINLHRMGCREYYIIEID